MNINIETILASASFLLILLIVFLLINLLKYQQHIYKKLHKLENNVRDEIQSSVQTRFLEASTEAKDLMDLALEVWRIDQRLDKLSGYLDENQRKALEISVNKLKRFVDRHDIEVKDYNNQKYNSGLSFVDVMTVENDGSISEDIIKETVEPAVFLKGQVVRKAKVILLSKN